MDAIVHCGGISCSEIPAYLLSLGYVGKSSRIFTQRNYSQTRCGAFKTNMRNILLIILLFASLSIFGQTESKTENYKPFNLQEAVEQLRIIHHDTTKQKMRNINEVEFTSGA